MEASKLSARGARSDKVQLQFDQIKPSLLQHATMHLPHSNLYSTPSFPTTQALFSVGPGSAADGRQWPLVTASAF